MGILVTYWGTAFGNRGLKAAKGRGKASRSMVSVEDELQYNSEGNH